MDDIAEKGDLWFETPDSHSLCRGGTNGPQHPSQLYAIAKYVRRGDTFLDYGAGSATTAEALKKADYLGVFIPKYLGLDVIKKNTEWCLDNFAEKNEYYEVDFKHNPTLHKIDQPDKSWDVVYSRHVVDHMDSFERAMDEHKRVAKRLVIVVGWVPFSNQDEHGIKNIDYRPSGGKLYPDEYTNSYSKKKVEEYLNDPEWEVIEFSEEVGVEVGGHDWLVVLRRKE